MLPPWCLPNARPLSAMIGRPSNTPDNSGCPARAIWHDWFLLQPPLRRDFLDHAFRSRRSPCLSCRHQCCGAYRRGFSPPGPGPGQWRCGRGGRDGAGVQLADAVEPHVDDLSGDRHRPLCRQARAAGPDRAGSGRSIQPPCAPVACPAAGDRSGGPEPNLAPAPGGDRVHAGAVAGVRSAAGAARGQSLSPQPAGRGLLLGARFRQFAAPGGDRRRCRGLPFAAGGVPVPAGRRDGGAGGRCRARCGGSWLVA